MSVKTIAVLAGAFNPLTRAHLALVEAGLGITDQVVCVVPRAYPHKQLEGAMLEDRVAMLRTASRAAGGLYSVAVTEGGLFVDIARELRASHPGAAIEFLCGRDAAERVLGWDYGPGHSLDGMLQEFGLLVAARQGEFVPPRHLEGRVRALRMNGSYDDDSSTEVRRRISAGEPWEHLVPGAIVELVRRIYLTPRSMTPSRPAHLARRPPSAAPAIPPRKRRPATGSPRDSSR